MVFAWQDGFGDKYDDSQYHRGEYRICGKLAYNDSYMKEYDMDWLMPYDEDTGEVYDTECSFEDMADAEQAALWWDECWEHIRSVYMG